MSLESVLITGGAGFVGSGLALGIKQAWSHCRVEVCDNLKRRGSELNLPRLKAAGIGFHHADVRSPEDLNDCPETELVIDASAEPSVQAGVAGSPHYVLSTNLMGTLNQLEWCRKRSSAFLLLSTSRVYPIAALNALPFEEQNTRYGWTQEAERMLGMEDGAVSERFPLQGVRSLYGCSKLSSEMFVQEYASQYGLKAMINRCGVLSGPWQMGKVDQGFMALWVAAHHFGRPLRYMGYGGTGKQVRDVLHIQDLLELVLLQCAEIKSWQAEVYNVGGGQAISTSLLELTNHCQQVTGKTVPITSVPQTSPLDLRVYLSSTGKVQGRYKWTPCRKVVEIVEDLHQWMRAHERELGGLLG